MTLTERLFSGQVLDSSTGLYYYGNGRYYDPSIGRYISPDPYLDAPFSSQRLDRYNFGFNNPLRYRRSEALPDFTVDIGKGVLVDEGLPAGTLTSTFGQMAADQAWVGAALQTTVGRVLESLERQYIGGFVIGRFSISASKTALQGMPKEIRALFPAIKDLKGTYRRQTVASLFRVMRGKNYDLIKQTITSRGPQSARWAPVVTDDFIRLGLGEVAAAGLVSAAFQLGEDWPRMQMYGLTPAQVGSRAAVIGGGAALGTMVVMALLCSASPPAWVTIPFVIFFAAAWEKGFAPAFFETTGLYGRYEFRPQGRGLDPGALAGRRTIF